MTSGGTFPQPGSGAVTIALSQPKFSVGDHLLTPVDLVGAAPVAFDPATALSLSGGTSYIDVGPNSFYLGEPVEYQQSGGPALSITADGDDVNFAQATAGSGGVVAGAAAMANTNTGGGTSASIADNTGPGTSLDVSSLTISALHTAQFDSQTNTTQADAVGFSGSWANNTDSSTVNAHIGNYRSDRHPEPSGAGDEHDREKPGAVGPEQRERRVRRRAARQRRAEHDDHHQ